VKRELVRTNAFIRAAKRLAKRNSQSIADVESALCLLATDAFDSRLKTHKLKGELDGVLACSAGYDLRILFEIVQREGGEAVLLLSMGTHDEVY
jgi:addiction module RelE/StbE family toxin